MNISRRSLLAGAFATTVYMSLWNIDPAKAKIKVHSKHFVENTHPGTLK